METVESREERRGVAAILDGAHVAEEIKRDVARDVEALKGEHGVTPCLVVVRVGEDPASAVYVGNKVRTSEELGLSSKHLALPADTTEVRLIGEVTGLNAREDVDGILVQLPLPKGIDERRVNEAIDPSKDVDGYHPLNIGRMTLGQPAFVPCTPAGIMELLAREGVSVRGAHAVIVGRSHIVGRPMAQLLLQRDATVTVCHSRTPDLAAHTRRADILVCAVGSPGLIRGEHVKPGAVVVDVGMNRLTGEEQAREFFGEDSARRIETIRKRGFTLVGDVHPAEVSRVAGRLTPVPGGVGPLTVAMLMRNTVTAARRRRGL
ncbi:MAG: bifunctional 5,10-methylenetetrahydrofolate dehydrogenase/5,10-methenyltetrahydrofolate cyclohydrolase [Acidobacteria bacterium]|nr:bifunctional 5,10-methylenetetrahydrofolate dehydrogenase/5,10-methenyltetrahydrofolate cyclohydrolase [Acidobacteriota bacterium]